MSTMRDGERAVPNSANPPAPVFREQAMAARGAARELGAAVSPGFARPARTNSDDS
jgi:hypothetical protein